ncbi:hypothetical protein [uncultured Rhodoblastus sp.]|uniref:hypothetical protein n=1 Tax=uncultured Rhodoblastus sp. TaxID=543037 RepID=UPI00260040B8|nr:hypothetical protein [uncultured Rhodoblastus sp.]
MRIIRKLQYAKLQYRFEFKAKRPLRAARGLLRFAHGHSANRSAKRSNTGAAYRTRDGKKFFQSWWGRDEPISGSRLRALALEKFWTLRLDCGRNSASVAYDGPRGDNPFDEDDSQWRRRDKSERCEIFGR